MTCRDCDKEFDPPKSMQREGKDIETCYECWSDDCDRCFGTLKMSKGEKIAWIVAFVVVCGGLLIWAVKGWL
jgi:hypothetical protein